MEKFIIALSDTITIERTLFVEIEAPDEDVAMAMVLAQSDNLVSTYHDAVDEDQIDNTPWSAEGPDEKSLMPGQTAVPWAEVQNVVPPIEWDGPTDSDGNPCNYLNFYECSECENEWTDAWSCACDDECGECHVDISPTHSDITDLVTGEVERQTW